MQSALLQKYEGVCEVLNGNSREDALFNCLEIQNDNVRLEVVKCLFNVPLKDFDIDEIAQLIKMMGTQNIGAGNTEIVLSYIYWILTKFVGDRDQDAGKIFRSKFGIPAINQGITIFKKNQLREVDDSDEELEKYTLSLSILNFLKFISLDPKL